MEKDVAKINMESVNSHVSMDTVDTNMKGAPDCTLKVHFLEFIMVNHMVATKTGRNISLKGYQDKNKYLLPGIESFGTGVHNDHYYCK